MKTPHRVVCVLNRKLPPLEFGVAMEIFGLPRPEFDAWYEFRVAAVSPGPIVGLGGLTAHVEAGLEALAEADTILIPGWPPSRGDVPEELITAVRAAHHRGTRIVSFCSGAFVLAHAGLLDGRRSTTHWRSADLLREAAPRSLFEPDVLFVDEGSVATSAGSAASMDLALHLVRKDFGAEKARIVAQRLVVTAVREGGQAQVVEAARSLDMPETSRIHRTMTWMLENMRQDLGVMELAELSVMSERTFVRHFRAVTGTTPRRWWVAQRLLRAQSLLETSALHVQEVAAACGFSSSAIFREHFFKRTRVTPTEYRAKFRAARS